MIKHNFLLFAILAMAFTASAQPEKAPAKGPDHVLKIWDNATAPHSNGITTPEVSNASGRVENVSEATLSIFRADPSKATGQAIVICPGGGYARLAMEHEGFQMARWFAENGITAAVLKYRMPKGHREVPLEDAEQALRIMKGEVAGAEGFVAPQVGIAGAEGFVAPQVGIAGCSAGGHLAAMVSTMGAVRPAFSILFYPVITGEAGKCHKGSFDNLLGVDRTEEQTAYYSLQNRVTAATPPALLLLSDDDRAVPTVSSTSYYDALKAQGIRASMHIYPSGGHGWGMRDGFAYKAQWQQAVLDWLETLK